MTAHVWAHASKYRLTYVCKINVFSCSKSTLRTLLFHSVHVMNSDAVFCFWVNIVESRTLLCYVHTQCFNFPFYFFYILCDKKWLRPGNSLFTTQRWCSKKHLSKRKYILENVAHNGRERSSGRETLGKPAKSIFVMFRAQISRL